MKANELMIDDWIYRPDCYDQVKEISNNGIIGLDSLRGRIMFGELKSIPLTAEILEKNGFEKRDGEYQDVFYHYEDLDLLIDDRLEPCGYTLYGVFELQIKYVHQLQHALRLAGIDKEITI